MKHIGLLSPKLHTHKIYLYFTLYIKTILCFVLIQTLFNKTIKTYKI